MMNKIILAIALFLCLLSCGSKADIQSELEDYIGTCDAEIGVAVIIGHKDTIVVNDGQYPMNSVLKLYQSMPTALKMSQKGISIFDSLDINRDDLQTDTWSPMLKEHLDSTFVISYGDLLGYALAQSDNNACDLLFSHIEKIEDVSSYWHSKGIEEFQIEWNETQMHEDVTRSDDNWTSPLAAAKVIDWMIPYSLASSDMNVSTVGGILMKCQTGQNRIAQALEDNAWIAHKTGTGFPDKNGCPTGINDVAFVMLPDGRCYSLAVFVKTSRAEMDATEAMIAHISKIVYDFVIKNYN